MSKPSLLSETGGNILEIKHLKTSFFTASGIIKAVDDVSLDLKDGEVLGLVGESGCGKSTLGLSITRLVHEPGRIVAGEILFKGFGNLLEKSESQMRKIRGANIAMVFQDPTTYLNPVHRVGDQIAEAIRLHQGLSKKEAWKVVIETMHSIGIPSPETRATQFPHEMSGGMKQRILIAIALSCRPRILIADEPTTALDVVVQDQILTLLRDVKTRFRTSIIMITHDLAVAAEISDIIGIMYCGQLVELGQVRRIFKNPRHPYTIGLLKSVPVASHKQSRLMTIDGEVPNMLRPPSGCRFHPRCKFATDECCKKTPTLREIEKEHKIACLFENGICFET